MKKLLAVATMVVLMAFVAGCGSDKTAYPEKNITVTSGDTLWSIAENYANPGDDIREVIFNIQRWNNISNADKGRLQPGTVIRIKIKENGKIAM